MAIRSGDPPRWLPPLADALAEALPRLVGEAPDPLLTALIRRETAMVERFRTLAGATPLALVSRHGPPRGLDRLSVLGHQLFTVSTRSPVKH